MTGTECDKMIAIADGMGKVEHITEGEAFRRGLLWYRDPQQWERYLKKRQAETFDRCKKRGGELF